MSWLRIYSLNLLLYQNTDTDLYTGEGFKSTHKSILSSLQQMNMESIDETRSFWDFIPKGVMPKSFLMSGRSKIDEMEVEDVSDSSFHDSKESPDSSHESDSEAGSKKLSLFRPSLESAFSKIGKQESSNKGGSPPLFPTPTSANMSAYYPTMFPHLYSGFLPTSSETGNSSSSSYFPYLTGDSITNSRENKTFDSPDKNMFYYVDPRIPFTNYFLNLTKLLNGNSKDYTATTPLSKMAGEDSRADDRDPPITPDSLKSVRGKSRTETISSPENENSIGENDVTPEKKELKIDIAPEKLNIPNMADPRIFNPFSASSMHIPHPASMIPLPSTGIFHPALMHLPGTAYRRYNPEKPPPVKKYKCDVCGKAFSRSNTLVTHKRIHTGDKPFKCEICSRAFRQPGNLTRHRLTHTTVKPYVCPTCNKAFNRASNLHTHMRTHTSFKAYVCPYCGKGFHQKIDMKIHCYTHTAHASRPEASPM